MSEKRDVRRQTFELRQSLIDAGITKIIAEIEDGNARHIIIEHTKGDKQPIIIPVAKDWYGDTKEKFRSMAEVYFIPETVLQIEREIGSIHLQLFDELAKEQEKRAAEARQKTKEAKAKMMAGTGTDGLPETEITATALGDELEPISVKQALFSPAGSTLTVHGQITAKGRIHSMVEGGIYQCMRCHQPQHIRFERPLTPTDDIPEVWRSICVYCEKQHLEPNTTEHRAACQLALRKINEIRAVRIELTDTEAYDETDNLQVVLFDKDAKEILIGEHAVINGQLYTLHSSRRGGLFYPVLYAHSLKYTNKDSYQLTTHDIHRVERFIEQAKNEKDPRTKQPKGERNIIDRLVWMYAPHVIWNWEAKEAQLYAEASSGPDRIGKGSQSFRRKRIHVGLIGNSGLGKTRTMESVKLHDERNRAESGISSSGKTITAIVAKEGSDGLPMLRTGAFVHAKGAVCGINELGEVDFEQQKYFQDGMEEGEFTLNKLGIHATVRADTVAVWTTNPVQGASFTGDRISIKEIPVRKQILDRTDYLIVFKPIKDKEKRSEFNNLKLALERASPARKKILSNYSEYVKIHLMVVKQRNPLSQITLSEAAADVLNEADLRIQDKKDSQDMPNVGSNRGLDTLIRTTLVIAMLKNKQEADVEDANHAIEFYNKVSVELNAGIVVPEDPALTAYNVMVFVLQNESNGRPMKFLELAEKACEKDKAVEWYLKGACGRLGDVKHNAKLQRVLHMLENLSGGGNIKRTGMVPAEFMWVGKQLQQEKEERQKGQEHKKSENSIQNERSIQNDTNSAQKDVSSIQGDVSDAGDANFFGVAQKSTSAEGENQDKNATSTEVVQTKNMTSQTSPTSPVRGIHIFINEQDEQQLIAAMRKAVYEPDGVRKAHFHLQWLWMTLLKTTKDRWTKAEMEAGLQQLTKKGWVVTRLGDPPDKYYFIPQDGAGGAQQSQ